MVLTRGGSGRPSTPTTAKPATLESLLSPEQLEMYPVYSCRKLEWSRASAAGMASAMACRIWNFSTSWCNNVWGTPGYDYDRFTETEPCLVSQFLLLHSNALAGVVRHGCRDTMAAVLPIVDPLTGGVPDKQLPARVRSALNEARGL